MDVIEKGRVLIFVLYLGLMFIARGVREIYMHMRYETLARRGSELLIL